MEDIIEKTTAAPIQDDEVRAALARILESETFSRTRRDGAFLSFVVEEALTGRGERLKAFTIAHEVYGRDENFDPRTDTIVRVEARRLRQRLDNYYEREGSTDPVLISLPKGGYTPRFRRNENILAGTAEHAMSAGNKLFANKMALFFASIALLVAIAVISSWTLIGRDSLTTPSASNTIAGTSAPSSNLFLAVLPLATLAGDTAEERLAAGLVEAIITDLAKLSGLSVMAHASLLQLDRQSIKLDTLSQDYGATHALRGSLESEGELIRVNVQLVDIASNTTIWADRLDGTVRNMLDIQDVLAERIVNQLAIQVSPDEIELLNKRHSNNPEALALYRNALVLLMPPNDSERITSARLMFQRIIDIDPEFGGGFAGVSFTHIVSALFLKGSEPGRELEIGINLALKAIKTDPEFGMGYVSLAFAYAMSGREEEALFNAEKAVTVQPGDAFTQFVLGMCLTLSGKPDEAVASISEAIRLDPAEPRTPYRNVLGITEYVRGEHKRAARLFEENLAAGGPTGPHMDVFHAATYAKLGEDEKARFIINQLVSSNSDFPVDRWSAKWHRTSNDHSATMDNLYRLGLPRP